MPRFQGRSFALIAPLVEDCFLLWLHSLATSARPTPPLAGPGVAGGRAVLDEGLRALPGRPGPDVSLPERMPALLRRAGP